MGPLSGANLAGVGGGTSDWRDGMISSRLALFSYF